MNDKPESNLTTADLASAADQSIQPAVDSQPQTESQPPVGTQLTGQQTPSERASLFSSDDASSLKQHWSDVQAGFVDDPRRAVEQADGLVADVIKRLAESFAGERSKLEGQWSRGEGVSTEDLRMALQRYRSFFDRLLSV